MKQYATIAKTADSEIAELVMSQLLTSTSIIQTGLAAVQEKLKKLRGNLGNSGPKPGMTPEAGLRPPSTIGNVCSFEEYDRDGAWYDLTESLISEFSGKILKYFGDTENLSDFQVRSRGFGLELRQFKGDKSRGYVITGNEGYVERLDLAKQLYRRWYPGVRIDREFDNGGDRAGFYWQSEDVTPSR